MRGFAVSCVALLAIFATNANAATGGGTQPRSSWDDMQTLEYNIGRIAAALNLCRRYSLSTEMKKISSLSPYGQMGFDKMSTFDGIRGCGGIANDAKQLLGDKEQLLDYLKAKYDCSGGKCVER